MAINPPEDLVKPYTSYTPTGDKPTGQAGPGAGATAVSVALHQRLERECAEACHLLF